MYGSRITFSGDPYKAAKLAFIDSQVSHSEMVYTENSRCCTDFFSLCFQ